MKVRRTGSALLLLSHLRISLAQTTCRDASLAPHQATTWQNQFPFDLNQLPVGLCDGTIEIKHDGGMCVTGKVSYGQLQAASGPDRPIYQLTAEEVSINGHMIGGSGYVWLGPDVHYLYDFITSYIVDGVTYQNDASINDNLLAASRGSIDGVCLSPAFRQVERFYKISHDVGLVGKKPLNTKKIKESSYTFVSRYFIVYEYHTWNDDSWFNLGSIPFTFSNFVTGLFTGISMPSITAESLGPLGVLPQNLFAPLARLLVFGTVSTTKFPVPVSAPDDITEGTYSTVCYGRNSTIRSLTFSALAIQIDTEYAALERALDAGLFSAKSIPVYFYVRFKKVEPFTGSNSCWSETAVILEITGPQQDGEALDAWVDEVVTPALLAAGGTIGLHFGKRIPPNSATLQAALSKYTSCGVETNISPTNCYHPQCTRALSPASFTYPPTYYSSDLSRAHERAANLRANGRDEPESSADLLF